MKALKWRRVEPTIVTKVDHRYVVVKTFIVPGTNKRFTFATYQPEGARAAGVVALTPENKVIVARQFRQGPEQVMDEIPGGKVDEGEDPQVAAQRELLEETGYAAGKMQLLGTNYGSAYNNGIWFYYLATGCTLSPDGPNSDENEPIEVKLISISALLRNAKRGGTTDPAAILMAYDKLKALEQEGRHAKN
jgi:ADP-ribose pyrophosphatase